MPKLKQSQTEIQNNQFRAAIAGASELHSFTVEELASYLGIAPNTLRDHKRNPERCTLGEFRKLCNKLGLTATQVCNICGVKYT